VMTGQTNAPVISTGAASAKETEANIAKIAIAHTPVKARDRESACACGI